MHLLPGQAGRAAERRRRPGGDPRAYRAQAPRGHRRPREPGAGLRPVQRRKRPPPRPPRPQRRPPHRGHPGAARSPQRPLAPGRAGPRLARRRRAPAALGARAAGRGPRGRQGEQSPCLPDQVGGGLRGRPGHGGRPGLHPRPALHAGRRPGSVHLAARAARHGAVAGEGAGRRADRRVRGGPGAAAPAPGARRRGPGAGARLGRRLRGPRGRGRGLVLRGAGGPLPAGLHARRRGAAGRHRLRPPRRAGELRRWVPLPAGVAGLDRRALGARGRGHEPPAVQAQHRRRGLRPGR